ncbi:MAG: hypothetical protein K8W52_07200 [Deltaproteobacteria bacterium]|nr:hypothetical protein [Deltaproteobacteria bacterium]
MRLLLALFAIVGLAACDLATSTADVSHGDPGAFPLECASDLDCVGASSTCCECPSYALPTSSGWQSTCDQVMCDPAPSCAQVAAVCSPAGQCTLACQPIACDLSCEFGFATDPAGCQVCACAPAIASECAVDADCARVPADCCGCGRGGADTAVPVGEIMSHADNLGCTGGAACPEVDVCQVGLVAQCVAGSCALVDPTSAPMPPPSDACGRPDLPACPAGTHCMLNTAPESAGVGRCAP